jgi:septal ring factor EnvC (AmiA/AmiB activator)
MTTERELLNLKEEIAAAKNKVAELKGQQNALLRQLKEEWGCTTIEQAKRKLTQMEKDITKLDEEIKKGMDELNEKYPT